MKIVRSDDSCIIKGRVYASLPTIVGEQGIEVEWSDWLRSLVLKGQAGETAFEYAKHAKQFLEYCNRRKVDWRDVSDAMLLDWSNDRASRGASEDRVAICQSTVFRFLVWAERQGIFRYRVQIYDREELPAEMGNYKFPVGTDVSVKQRNYGNYRRYTWTYQRPLHRGSFGRRHTPTEDEVRAIHEAAFISPLGERDTLIYSWAEFAGVRVGEAMRVCCSQMPSGFELDRLIDTGTDITIKLLGKGNRKRNVLVPRGLVLMTVSYIEGARRDVIARFKAKSPSYVEPDELFLSATSGRPLTPNSVSHRAQRAFRAAGVKNASIHRLRARFAVEAIEAHLDAIQDADTRLGSEATASSTILFKVADLMGHRHLESLRPYLNYALDRRLSATPTARRSRAQTKLRALERLEVSLLRKTAAYEGFKKILAALETSDPREAAAMLRRLADRLLDSQGLSTVDACLEYEP